MYKLKINSIDRTGDVLNESLAFDLAGAGQNASLRFSFVNRSGLSDVKETDEIELLVNSEIVFGGQVTDIVRNKRSTGLVVAQVLCSDWTFLFDSNLVAKSYTNMTDKEIINDIVADYASGFGFTTNFVEEHVTFNRIIFNYQEPSQCIRKICEMTSNEFYIDAQKNLHYFNLGTEVTPFNIDENSNQHSNLRIEKDIKALKNRVYVRGGTFLSEFTIYEEKGDGEKRTFILPERPHESTLWINDTELSIGIKNIDTSGFDSYLSYSEKYIELEDSIPTPTSADTFKLQYKYNIPILVAIEESNSIQEYGQKEFAIFDRSIRSTEEARERAVAELIDYGNRIVSGVFTTRVDGFHSGQTINIDLPEYDVNEDYFVRSVKGESLGAGQFLYSVEIASSKTMGIIRFLIKLLEDNMNLIELNEDEVVDELNELYDFLLEDSLTDDLQFETQDENFTWTFEGDTSNTKGRWNLSSWGV